MMLWALKSQVKLTESQVDDDVVRTEVCVDVALVADEQRRRLALRREGSR